MKIAMIAKTTISPAGTAAGFRHPQWGQAFAVSLIGCLQSGHGTTQEGYPW